MSAILEDVPEAIETDRLLIRCPRSGDGPAFHEAVHETFAVLYQWMDWANVKPTHEEAEASVREGYALYVSRKDLRMSLFEKRTSKFIGGSGLHNVDWASRRFEIGYWCRASAQGKGFISEAVRAISDMAFDQLRAKRLEIFCSHRNQRSQRVAEKSGFKLEATLRNHRLEKSGKMRDTLIYARFPDDA